MVVVDTAIKHWKEEEHKAAVRGHHALAEINKGKVEHYEKERRELRQHIGHWRVISKGRHEFLEEKIKSTPHLVHNGNIVEGGTLEERFYYSIHQGRKHWRDFYSEPGGETDAPWAITNVPNNTLRSDCSKYAQKECQTIQIPDPTGQNFGPMFTGTIVANCKEVSREYAETHFGTAVLFGSGDAFHMGLSMAHGDLIIQHGVPQLEFGTFDEFGPGTQVRFYKFIS